MEFLVQALISAQALVFDLAQLTCLKRFDCRNAILGSSAILLGMENIRFRRANLKDKADILMLREDVHGGRDILPSMIDHILSSTKFIPGVMLDGKRIVGYMAARIVDEGETVVLLTGRVHKDYEGKSYIDVLGRYLGSLAVQQGVTLILSVKKSSEFLEMPIVTERYKHLYNVNCFAFLLDPGSITLQNNDIKLAGSLHNLSYGRLSSNLQLEETRKYLAPNGRLFIQVVPLKVEKDNTEHIIGHDDSTVTYYDVMVENGTHRGLMSRGILYKTAENASFQNVYLLDIVGSDMRSIRKHLVKHVLRIKQNAQGKTKLFICSSEDFDRSSLLTSINDSGMDRLCLESQRSSFVFGIVEVFNAFKSKY